ncbi:transposase IS66 family protein [Sinorhizobium medicae]|nr:transposase IS66 family protein [Sinorhizobium medicae]
MAQRIDALFDIEREINGQRAEVRKAARQDRTLPLVLDLEAWMKAQRPKLSRNDDLAKAFDYLLNRWPAFTFFLDDGRVCLSNNAAERALRGIRWAGNPGYSPVRTAVASAPRPCTA